MTSAELRAMDDDALVDFVESVLGLQVTDEDLLPTGQYNRGRLLTRAMRLAIQIR